ncbi:trypsin-like serine protease [Herbaspirillum sp. HC18]|nr:trypsin-like serine protease [Herbaspirillum sp. HC18]
MNPHWIRRLAAPIAACAMLQGTAYAQTAADGPTGTSRQPLVGESADERTQEEFGLIRLSNGEKQCSATMLNDYWAITAAHCVISTTGRMFAPNEITLSSNWPNRHKTANAAKIVPFSAAAPWQPNDIALIQTGRHDFGRSGTPNYKERKLYNQAPRSDQKIKAFGAGFSRLASGSGDSAQKSQFDGLYRTAGFIIGEVMFDPSGTAATYSFPLRVGAYVTAGDSGGPSFIQVGDDRRSEWQLIGVHSKVDGVECLEGKSCPASDQWTWAASVDKATDAAVYPIRDTILSTIQEVPLDSGDQGQFPSTVPPEVLAHKRALYAKSIDEPLVAPPGAAISVQLTFQQCHDLRVAGSGGCPVTPELEQWSYNTATHQLLHVASNQCVSITDARHDEGAPIILYPCMDAPNEKWTVIAPGGASEWTIKSDLTGQCLHAAPGTVGATNGGGLSRTRPKPATLVQMPCDGSNAQLFSDVDADWFRRNGPR